MLYQRAQALYSGARFTHLRSAQRSLTRARNPQRVFKMSLSDAKIVSTEPLEAKDAKWTRLIRAVYKNPNGEDKVWEYAERPTRPKGSSVDAVGIVAILNKGSGPEILLQKQFRPPTGKVCIEIPAGLVDPGEGVEKCAVRELKEETGYVGTVQRGAGMSVGPVLFNDPGFCNTNLNMVHVAVDMSQEENKNPKPELEENEFIECFSVPLDKFYGECMRLEEQGFAIDARVGTLAEGIELAKQWKLA